MADDEQDAPRATWLEKEAAAQARRGAAGPKLPTKRAKEIPISAAEEIAKRYGYDQVVIVARAVGDCEHVTTYGVDKANCDVAARIGNFFKHKLMGWPEPKG